MTFDAVVVQHVWRAVDRDADFFQVREDVLFRISCTCGVRLHKQQNNALHGSSLGVDFYVYSRLCSSVDRHHFWPAHVIIGKLFSGCVDAFRLFCEILAVDHLIFQLDVRQLVFQLGRV